MDPQRPGRVGTRGGLLGDDGRDRAGVGGEVLDVAVGPEIDARHQPHGWQVDQRQPAAEQAQPGALPDAGDGHRQPDVGRHRQLPDACHRCDAGDLAAPRVHEGAVAQAADLDLGVRAAVDLEPQPATDLEQLGWRGQRHPLDVGGADRPDAVGLGPDARDALAGHPQATPLALDRIADAHHLLQPGLRKRHHAVGRHGQPARRGQLDSLWLCGLGRIEAQQRVLASASPPGHLPARHANPRVVARRSQRGRPVDLARARDAPPPHGVADCVFTGPSVFTGTFALATLAAAAAQRQRIRQHHEPYQPARSVSR